MSNRICGEICFICGETLRICLETETHHDEVHHMKRALDILNNYSNDTHKISDIIEIRIPFKRTSLPIELFDFQSWIEAVRDKPDSLIKAIKDAQSAANYMDLKAGLINEKEYEKVKDSVMEAKICIMRYSDQ